MGEGVGPPLSIDQDHFISVIKGNKENPDVVSVNASELARRMQKAQKDALAEFLKSEGIFEDDTGIFVGLDLPKDYELRNTLLDYFKKLNKRRWEVLEQEQSQKLNLIRRKIGIPVEEKETNGHCGSTV